MRNRESLCDDPVSLNLTETLIDLSSPLAQRHAHLTTLRPRSTAMWQPAHMAVSKPRVRKVEKNNLHIIRKF